MFPSCRMAMWRGRRAHRLATPAGTQLRELGTCSGERRNCETCSATAGGYDSGGSARSLRNPSTITDCSGFRQAAMTCLAQLP